MAFLKEHHHKLLVTLFLIGALFVAGSFEARLPDSAIAGTTTPGSKSEQKNAVWNFNYGQPDDYNTAAMTQVNYTGEVRDKSTGALITSETKLKPGDQVTLDIFANASYFVTGAWSDSPPAPWVGDDFLTKLLPSPWFYRVTVPNAHTFSVYGTAQSLSAPEVYAYEYYDYPPNLTLPNAPSNYCPSGHLTGISGNYPFCLQTSVKKPAVSLSTGGMNCGALAESDTSEGARKYSTTCTITTSGPQAQLTSNIGSTKFYYPMRAREIGPAAPYSGIKDGSGNLYSSQSGESCQTVCTETEGGDQTYTNCEEQCSTSVDPGPYSGYIDCHFGNNNNCIGNFYAPGNIDAATLAWNIDVVPPPTADIKANNSDGPIGIAHNAAATLSWTSTNADSCSAFGDWSGSKAVSGSESTGNLTLNKTYVITCANASGSASDSVTVNVGAAATAADIKANGSDGPVTVAYNTAANVSWTSQNAASCSVSPTGWTGTSNTGISTGNLTSPQTYTLSCTGGGSPSSDSVTVNVGAVPSPILTFTGAPTTITAGQSSALTWTSQNTTSCTASNGWSGAKAVSGSENVTPPSTTTYNLSCQGAGGNVSSSVTITVISTPPPPPFGFSCNSQNQCVLGGGGASCSLNANCEGVIINPPCTSNCGGGGGGGGGGGISALAPSATANTASSNFFCPTSQQMVLPWTYSDPNNSAQASYKLQVDDNSDFSSMQIDTGIVASSVHEYVTPAGVLTASKTYYWRVAVKNSAGLWSIFSNMASFTTPSCAPLPDYGLNKSNDISVNVTGSGNSTSNASQITVTPFSGFNSVVSLSVQSTSPNLPGASYNLSPTTLPQNKYSSGSTFKVTVPGSTVPGNYVITIKGEGGNPTLTRTVNVNLKVNSTSPVFREI